jgi:hypothetical protein
MNVTSPARLAGMIAGIAVAFGIVVAAQDVSYTAMPGTDFTKFKTYKWVAVEKAQKPDQITDRMITQSIDAQLAKKGLTKTTDDAADLFVAYQVAVDKETQWYAYNTGPSMYWGYGMGGYGMGGTGMSTATSETITIGTLDFDMYDRTAKQLVWKGRASKTLDTKSTPEKRTKNIDKATEKMFKNYPPPVKKK